MVARIVIAVIVAGIAGTLANSALVAALTPNEFAPPAASPGRNAVAVLLPLLFATLPRLPAAAASLAALAVVPSILAKTVFGIGAPWGFVLGVNAVYALGALIVYTAIVRPTNRSVG